MTLNPFVEGSTPSRPTIHMLLSYAEETVQLNLVN